MSFIKNKLLLALCIVAVIVCVVISPFVYFTSLILVPFIFKFAFNEEKDIGDDATKRYQFIVYVIKFIYVVLLIFYFYISMKDQFYVSSITGYLS
jgi:hypothetical protein